MISLGAVAQPQVEVHLCKVEKLDASIKTFLANPVINGD